MIHRLLIVPRMYKERRKMNNFLNVDICYFQFTYGKHFEILFISFSVEYALDVLFVETFNLAKVKHI